MAKAKKKEVPVPEWLGKHPFPADKKKPALIKADDEIPTVYGLPGHQVRSFVYVSTDQLTFSDFTVPPGSYFLPPDIHAGDEIYYVLKGTATCFCPDTGTAFEAVEGDGLYIPKGAWHQVFNFTDKEMTIVCTIAPMNWSDEDGMGSAVEYTRQPAFFKSAKGGAQSRDARMNMLGKWPAKSAARAGPSKLVHVPAKNRLHLIHGRDHHTFVSFIASSKRVHMGIITVPVDRFSDPEAHEGDEALMVLEGILMLRIHDEHDTDSVSQVCPSVRQGEKFLIPAGVKHQYLNLSDKTLKVLFTVAPEL